MAMTQVEPEMRDWPMPLVVNAAAVELAEQLVREFGPEPWKDMTPAARDRWIDFALEALPYLRPELPLDVVRKVRAERRWLGTKVVAAITPDAPWGDPVIDARD